MIAYATTRDQAAFPAYHATNTSSHMRLGDTFTDSDSWEQRISIEGGTSVTVVQGNGYYTASFNTNGHTYNASQGGAYGSTTSANATVYSTSSSSSFYSSFSSRELGGGTDDPGYITDSTSVSYHTEDSSSSTSAITDTLYLPTVSSTDWTKAVTTATTTSSTHYTVSGHTLSTASTTYDVTTATTVASSTSMMSYYSTESVFHTYYEWGAVVSAESEWLWIPEAEGTAPHFVTDFASSCDGITTFWPQAVYVPMSYVVGDSDASSSTLVVPGSVSNFTYDLLQYTRTIQTTLTSGDYLSRTTYTSSTAVVDTDTATTAFGNEPQTITALETQAVTLTTYAPFSIVNKELYFSGQFNLSTTSVRGVYEAFSTTTGYSIVPALYGGGSTVLDFGGGVSGTYEDGGSVEGTDVSYKNYSFIPFGELPSALTPVAPYGCFVSPHELRGAGNPYAFGSNLSFQPQHIPYGELRSVFSNAQLPYPVAFTTTGTDSHTFRYAWSGETLHVTEQSTNVAGTKTQTHTSSSSGTFSTMGSESQYFQLGGNCYGGFQPIESASESVTFYPRAVLGTRISTDGSSETYRSLVTSFQQSTLQETLIVENAVPAYRVWTYLGAANGGDQPYLIFPRN